MLWRSEAPENASRLMYYKPESLHYLGVVLPDNAGLLQFSRPLGMSRACSTSMLAC